MTRDNALRFAIEDHDRRVLACLCGPMGRVRPGDIPSDIETQATLQRMMDPGFEILDVFFANGAVVVRDPAPAADLSEPEACPKCGNSDKLQITTRTRHVLPDQPWHRGGHVLLGYRCERCGAALDTAMHEEQEKA